MSQLMQSYQQFYTIMEKLRSEESIKEHELISIEYRNEMDSFDVWHATLYKKGYKNTVAIFRLWKTHNQVDILCYPGELIQPNKLISINEKRN